MYERKWAIVQVQLKLVSSQFCNKISLKRVHDISPFFESLFNSTRFAILPLWIIASWSKRSSQRNIYITLLQSSLLKSPFATKDFLITFPLLLPHLWLFRISLNSYTQIGLFPSRKEFQNLLSWIWGNRKKPRKSFRKSRVMFCTSVCFWEYGNFRIIPQYAANKRSLRQQFPEHTDSSLQFRNYMAVLDTR